MPTPVEHYETAEDYLEQATKATDPLHAQRLTQRAGVHATLAGVPWAIDDRGDVELAAGLTAEQVAALIAVVEELHRFAHGQPAIPAALDDDPTEAWVAGAMAHRQAVAMLVDPIAAEVLPG